jgi:predicted  nucleic acid-binding Zn-ribbon protein
VFKSVEFEVQLGMLFILGLVIYLFYRYKSASLTGKRSPLSSDETAIAIQAMTEVSTAASNSADATMRLTAEIKDHVESMNAIQRTLVENHAQSESHLNHMADRIEQLSRSVDALISHIKTAD